MATSTTISNSSSPLVNYFSRDYATLKKDLINYASTYHSDVFSYLNENSPDILYIGLLAYIGDTLNYTIDKAFNESFLETAQARESIVRIAQDLGFMNFFPTPSSTQIVLQINVPAIANSTGTAMIPDPSYLFGIMPGLTVQSDNGTNFECLDEINFSQGNNRTIIPNLDSNGILIDYSVQVAASVYAGQTQIQRFYVSQATSRPFLQVQLDDTAVTEILAVKIVSGNTYTIPTDEEFRTDNNDIYYQVDNLAQDKIFVETNLPENLRALTDIYTDMTIEYGDWVSKNKRFIVRKDENNQTFLTFGSTLVDFTSWNNAINSVDVNTVPGFDLNQVLNNMSLGEVPPIDSTLFIKFRTGAGANTNVLTNSVNNIVSKQIFTPSTPSNLTTFTTVQNSLTIISSLPAVGGMDMLSNQEIQQSAGKVFSTNSRAVTYEDVKNLIKDMPIQYGQPFRVSYEEIKPQVLSFNQIQNYLTQQLAALQLIQSTVERQQLIQTIQAWINDYPNQVALINSQTNTPASISSITDSLITPDNTVQHALWFGEKCRLYVLGLNESLQPTTLYQDTNGLWVSPNELLKQNIRNFLQDKRIIGDWIDIVDAKVINFQIEFSILANSKNQQQVLIDCLTALRTYFNVYNWQINQAIFISDVQTLLQEIDGVINVVSLNFFNIFDTDLTTGLKYSPQQIGRYPYLATSSTNSQNNRFQMLGINNVIVSAPDTFLSIAYPESDIIGSII